MPDMDMDQHNKATFTDESIKLFSKRLKRTRGFIACGQHLPVGHSGLPHEPCQDIPASNGDIPSEHKTRLHSTSAIAFTPRLLQRERSWAVVDVKNLKSKKLQSQSSVDIHQIHNHDHQEHSRTRKWSSKAAPTMKPLLTDLSKSSIALPKTSVKPSERNPKSSGSVKADALKSPSMSTLASKSYSSFREEPLYQVVPKRSSRPNTALGSASSHRVRANHGSVPDVREPVLRPRTAMKEPSIKTRLATQEKGHRPKTSMEGSRTRSWAEFFKQKEVSKKGRASAELKDIPSSTKNSTGSRRKALKNQIVTQRVETYQNLRTRSPSPGYTNHYSQRSRSLSSRRTETANRPPTGRQTTKKPPERDTSASRCSSSNSRSRQRRSSVPYVKWKQNADSQARNSPSEGMNGESLPPLPSNRSESALSKRSSRESLLSAGSSIPRGSILKLEKPVLISVDEPLNQGGSVKRSHLSPASANSGSSTNSKGNGSIPRNRSWGTIDSTIPNKAGQLETLFEQKGQVQSSISQEVNGENVSTFAIAESAIDSGYNSYSKSKNMKNQIREQRRGSLVSSTVNGKISPGKRTQSVSNITNPSDNSGRDDVISNTNKGGRKELPRIRSENTLCVPHTTLRGPSSPRVTTQNQSLRTTNGKSFNRTKSQPALMQNDSELNEKNLQKNVKKQTKQKSKDNNNTVEEQDEAGASDGEKNNRIVEWLLGVQSAERPPSPIIVEEEEPPQTDTAIHVVYSGNR